MALIKCPECGKEVSDKAKVCINCGCPIQELNPAGTVSILIGGTAIVKMYVINLKTGEELWCGRCGQVAKFDVNEETEIAVIGSLERRHPERGAKAVVRGNKRYEYKTIQNGFGVSYAINEVDVIDSGR